VHGFSISNYGHGCSSAQAGHGAWFMQVQFMVDQAMSRPANHGMTVATNSDAPLQASTNYFLLHSARSGRDPTATVYTMAKIHKVVYTTVYTAICLAPWPAHHALHHPSHHILHHDLHHAYTARAAGDITAFNHPERVSSLRESGWGKERECWNEGEGMGEESGGKRERDRECLKHRERK
jgi:hypothetical protein